MPKQLTRKIPINCGSPKWLDISPEWLILRREQLAKEFHITLADISFHTEYATDTYRNVPIVRLYADFESDEWEMEKELRLEVEKVEASILELSEMKVLEELASKYGWKKKDAKAN